ncbi:MAG: hypothetical protein CSA97_04500 [Bacteroidetes bacterium]|nr:MAG: hypothetical protein CSA97_04500 [Bacteroidota bacterium]
MLPRETTTRGAIIALGLGLLVLTSSFYGQEEPPKAPSALLQAMERDTLRVALEANTVSYHLDGGRPTGYQYAVAHDVADYLGLELEIVPIDSAAEGIAHLQARRADLLLPSQPVRDTAGLGWTRPYDRGRGKDTQDSLCLYMLGGYPKMVDTLNGYVASYRQSKLRKELRWLYRSARTKPPQGGYNCQGKISPYDADIKAACRGTSIDWRLLASVMYQESRFKASLVSYAGAFGIMQFEPTTARTFGISRTSPVKAQIKAGVKYLCWLEQHIEGEELSPKSRRALMLAAYNSGLGNTRRARKKAAAEGKSPDLWWGNVELYISKKARFGEGQTVAYVREVCERYRDYCLLTEE